MFWEKHKFRWKKSKIRAWLMYMTHISIIPYRYVPLVKVDTEMASEVS